MISLVSRPKHPLTSMWKDKRDCYNLVANSFRFTHHPPRHLNEWMSVWVNEWMNTQIKNFSQFDISKYQIKVSKDFFLLRALIEEFVLDFFFFDFGWLSFACSCHYFLQLSVNPHFLFSQLIPSCWIGTFLNYFILI